MFLSVHLENLGKKKVKWQTNPNLIHSFHLTHIPTVFFINLQRITATSPQPDLFFLRRLFAACLHMFCPCFLLTRFLFNSTFLDLSGLGHVPYLWGGGWKDVPGRVCDRIKR